MMSRKEMIDSFRTNDGNGFETISIRTNDDRSRSISFGTYFYNPGASEIDEEGNDLDWRVVNEFVKIDLSEFIHMIIGHIHISNADECNNRPCDDIDDLTETEAVEQFTKIVDTYPFISKDDITMDTPDGDYLTQLF